MRLSRPSLEQTPHPRPPRATEVLRGIKDEQDDGVEFEPGRDLRPTDWEGMKGRLDELRGAGEWWNFGFMAADLFLLFPDRKDDLKLDDELFEVMKGELEKKYRGSSWLGFSYMAMNLSLLFPDRRAELDLDEAFEGMKGQLDEFRGTNWMGFSFMAVNLCLLFPDRKDELQLDDVAFAGMKEQFEVSRGRKDWWDFSHMATYLSLLFPEHTAELDLDDEAFEGMKRELEVRRRTDDWWNFSTIAMHLTILAADSAQITHDGRILIVPKRSRLSPDPKPLPEQSRL